jgi:hypothetical protein
VRATVLSISFDMLNHQGNFMPIDAMTHVFPLPARVLRSPEDKTPICDAASGNTHFSEALVLALFQDNRDHPGCNSGERVFTRATRLSGPDFLQRHELPDAGLNRLRKTTPLETTA